MRLMLDRLKFDRVITDSSYLMFPDTTAFKRYEKMLPNRYFLGLKNRDFKTGKITSYRLVPPEGQLDPRQAVFIVDDLCAKGTTALNAGLELKKLGFQNIYLVVPHCEDTVFDGELLKDDSPVKLIYTKGTMIRPEHPKIKVI
jgi:ribose-phosphate pyrophosphokinase